MTSQPEALTESQAFRVGFLMRCAEECLTTEQTRHRIEQAAMEKSADAWERAFDTIKFIGEKAILSPAQRVISDIYKNQLLLAAGPPTVGAMLGYAAAQAHDDPYSEEDVRKQELINAYRRAATSLARSRHSNPGNLMSGAGRS